MKRLLPLSILLLTACHNAHEAIIPEATDATTVSIRVMGDFRTKHEDMTRTATPLGEDNTAALTDLWLLDYDGDGSLLQQLHQSDTEDADFGNPDITLTYGQHNIAIIASKGDNPTLADTDLSWTKVKDTHTTILPLTVGASTATTITAELQRAITCLTIINSDTIPANAATLTITISARYNALSLPSLTALADDAGSWTNTFTLTATNAGVTGIRFNTYTLCPSNDTFTLDATITTTATDGTTISTFTISGIELLRNRKTILTGPVFDRTSGFTISIDDVWDTSLDLTF